MQRNASEQIIDILEKAKSVLVALPANPSVDIVSGAIGLRIFLQQRGKKASVVGSGPLPAHLSFLPQPLPIEARLAGGNSLVVVLRAGEDGLDQLSYVVEGEEVKIYLKPKSGSFSPDQVSVASDSQVYDVIITLGARSFEDLGSIYQENAELFYNTPKVVIDTDAANEYFGAVNIIEITASGVSEVLLEVCKSIDAAAITKEVATSFLAGVISSTHSFQDVRTTPKTLGAAAELVEHGADQQNIIVSLFKTKEFPLLKLWGRALARIKTDDQLSLLYTALTSQDFEKTQTTTDQTLPVLREVVENVSGYQTLALLAQSDTGVEVCIASPPHVALGDIAVAMGAVGAAPQPLQGIFQYVDFTLKDGELSQVEQSLVEAVRNNGR